MIKLDDTFYVEKDTASWNLIERLSKAKDRSGKLKQKDGEQLWNEDVTYHVNLAQALVTYLDNSLAPAKSVKEVVKLLNEAEVRVYEAVKNVNSNSKS